jgi:hypothetical protein
VLTTVCGKAEVEMKQNRSSKFRFHDGQLFNVILVNTTSSADIDLVPSLHLLVL